MDGYGSGYYYDFLAGLAALAHQVGGLAHGGFYLALRGDAVAHEGEGHAVAFLRFGDYADAAHADYYLVSFFEVAEAAADGVFAGDDDHGVHALVFDFEPIAFLADQGFVIRGGIEIFGGAAIALDCCQFSGAGVGGGAA